MAFGVASENPVDPSVKTWLRTTSMDPMYPAEPDVAKAALSPTVGTGKAENIWTRNVALVIEVPVF
jgi:hypothetical protein